MIYACFFSHHTWWPKWSWKTSNLLSFGIFRHPAWAVGSYSSGPAAAESAGTKWTGGFPRSLGPPCKFFWCPVNSYWIRDAVSQNLERDEDRFSTQGRRAGRGVWRRKNTPTVHGGLHGGILPLALDPHHWIGWVSFLAYFRPVHRYQSGLTFIRFLCELLLYKRYSTVSEINVNSHIKIIKVQPHI